MITNRLYGIIIELAFGEKNVIYVVADSFKSRKELGPILSSLLETQDIFISNCNSYEWTIQYEEVEKYLRFTTGVNLTEAEKKYSTEVYV